MQRYKKQQLYNILEICQWVLQIIFASAEGTIYFGLEVLMHSIIIFSLLSVYAHQHSRCSHKTRTELSIGVKLLKFNGCFVRKHYECLDHTSYFLGQKEG